ncbi:MAG: tRNA-dihydrouridine synthase family protein [Faecalibacterium sp.]
MRYYFAPLESVTTALFRKLHHQHFGGVTQYYMPFVSPTQQHTFTPRHLRDLAPEYNEGVPAVPQILCRKADDFIWSVRALCEMGYPEVNLNLGCPSQTVTAKGKGSGFLRYPTELDSFLEESYAAFAALPVKVSVKTRLGKLDAAEFGQILEIYNRYPIAELTIHPRVQKQFYKGKPDVAAFATALANSKNPVCYNGDIVTVADYQALMAQFPTLQSVMIGRGAMADPALFTKLEGGQPLSKAALRDFSEDLFAQYAALYGNENNALIRMRDVWFYMVHLFAENDEFVQQFRRCRTPVEYKILQNRIFKECELRTDAGTGFQF